MSSVAGARWFRDLILMDFFVFAVARAWRYGVAVRINNGGVLMQNLIVQTADGLKVELVLLLSIFLILISLRFFIIILPSYFLESITFHH